MEGTGAAAVLVRQQAGGPHPNRHNTMTFPRLVVEVTSIPSATCMAMRSHRMMGRFHTDSGGADRYLRNMDHREVMWG